MPGQPILPSNVADPTGVDRRERGAIADFDRRLKRIRTLYVSALAGFQVQKVRVNADMYRYQLTPTLLQSTLEGISAQVDRILVEGGEQNLWFMDAYVQPAYQQGTAQQFANLSVQSTVYTASRPTLTSILTSDAYTTRLAFLKGREFENMKNFSTEVSARMSNVLQDGLATGKNPLQIARELSDATGISYRRAENIARTEVPGALRSARMAEADQVNTDLGIKTKEMHLSALSSVTRPWHRARHATLHTTQEQREWWSQDGNRYRCKCSTVTVLVTDKGEPLTPGIIAKAQAMLANNPAPPLRG